MKDIRNSENDSLSRAPCEPEPKEVCPGRISTKEIAGLAVFCAMMTAGKELMNVLPNIHPVVLFLMLGTELYGYRMLYAAAGFVIIETSLFGFGMWTLSYVYIWPLYTVLAAVFRNRKSRLFKAVLAGIFGLFFGALCAIPYFFLGGWKAAFAYWIAGIPFDIAHAAGNFLLVLVLFRPLQRMLIRAVRTQVPE